MKNGICLISPETSALDPFAASLSKCGLTVWRAADAKAFCSDALRRSTLCLIVDLPGEAGLSLVETLRDAGSGTPAILLTDARALPRERVSHASILDVLSKPVDTRALLGWIECICVAGMMLKRETLLQDQSRRATHMPAPRAASNVRALKTGTAG